MNGDAFCVFISGYGVSSPSKSRGEEVKLTFHVSFPLIYDERIAVALSLSISDYTYTFYGAIHLELATKISLGGFL